MAKDTSAFRPKKRIRRKGRHSKCETSFNKNSTLYVKRYKGQGK